MNDEDFTVALLVRVVDDLSPDVPALVSAGTQRGRVLSRRRRVALGVAGTTLLAVGAVALGQLPNVATEGEATRDAESFGADTRRSLAVTPADLAPTLSRLLPGEEPRTEVGKGVTLPSGMMRAGLVWHGARVSIGIDPSSEDRTPGVLTLAELQAFLDGRPIDSFSSPEERAEWVPAGLGPQDWCDVVASRAAAAAPAGGEQRGACTSLGGGNWASWHSIADMSVDGSGGATNWETSYELYTDDGYLIQVQAHGVRGVEDPATSPVLSTEQLREIAESKTWFK
jgi:hypothetical protein